MHTLLDLRGTSRASFTSRRQLHDVHALALLIPEAGAIYVGSRLHRLRAPLRLHQAGAFFVTRAVAWAHRVYSRRQIGDRIIAARLSHVFYQQGLSRHLRRASAASLVLPFPPGADERYAASPAASACFSGKARSRLRCLGSPTACGGRGRVPSRPAHRHQAPRLTCPRTCSRARTTGSTLPAFSASASASTKSRASYPKQWRHASFSIRGILDRRRKPHRLRPCRWPSASCDLSRSPYQG